jgi:hypothetical protein
MKLLVKKTKTETQSPNVVVEWLTLLLRIREVPDSNMGLKTGYPGRFLVFFQSFQGNAGIVPYVRSRPFLPHTFQFITQLSPSHSKLHILTY